MREHNGPDIPPFHHDAATFAKAALTIDQVDHAFFPRAGYRAVASAYAATTSFGSAQDYQRFEGFANVVHSWGPHTLNLNVSGGTDFGSDMPAYESFALGGPLRLSGFRIGQFNGHEFAFGRLLSR